MVLDSLLYPLRLNADIPLRGGGTAVLQQPLHKGNIVAVILVNLCCVPLAEAVGAYVGIVKIITDDWIARFIMGKSRSLRWMPSSGLSAK